jgi:hypothetical protein
MKPINCYADALCTMHYALCKEGKRKKVKKKNYKAAGHHIVIAFSNQSFLRVFMVSVPRKCSARS